MFLKQLVNFVTIRQDDGRDVMMKYMLTHRNPSTFGVLAEKHVMFDGEMCFEEECETRGSYNLQDALLIAQVCTSGKVLPTTYLEIEEELCREQTVSLSEV
ncbi:MAG: hypothetical protein FWD96_02595 [Defluviitaleaceae bacterium]|nr:hypothetical protein [Defluviitaleaceae bacterium]